MSTRGPKVFVQCGLRLRAEMDLHLPAAPAGDWDVDIRWGTDIGDSREPPPGEVIAVYGSGETAWYTATSEPSGYRLRFRECGEFLISEDLREVEVRRDRAGRMELLPILLAGTVTAFLLALHGDTVLHASAVSIDGAALAFVGQSGRGKSTLAALLCTAGAELVTDDVLTVQPGPPVTCIGGSSELRLRETAAVIAQERPGATTRKTADERIAFAPDAAPSGPMPLSGIVIPSPSRTAEQVEVTRLPASTALFAMLAFPRVHGWTHPGVLSRDFATLSQIVNLIPVYDVTIPWGPPFSPAVAPALLGLAAGGAEVSRPEP